MKLRLLDLFCGAGGAAVGYSRAGFEVVGVDLHPQPNYPFEFVQYDALDVLNPEDSRYFDSILGGWMVSEFDAIHASPPCQLYTKAQQLRGRQHPGLISLVRELLEATGLPWVIENVKRAPLRSAQMLEGQMFGLNTHRPRLFETNWGYEAPHLRPPPPRQAKMGRPPKAGEAIQVVGHFSDVAAARAAMGIDWMTQDELREAIPPAYTEHIGEYLLTHLKAKAAA